MIVRRANVAAFDGPLDEINAKLSQFSKLTAAYLTGASSLPARTAKIGELKMLATKLPPDSAPRKELLERIKYLEGEVGALGAGRKLIGPAVAKARSLLAKIFPGQFGQFDPVSLLAASAALVGATALLVGWTKREGRLKDELSLTEKKYALIAQGLLPPDVDRKPSFLGDLKGTLLIAGALFALVAFGPKLLGGRK